MLIKEKSIYKHPKKTKYKKAFRGSIKIINNNNSNNINTTVIIKTTSAGFLSWKNITECLKILKKLSKKKSKKTKIWINAMINWPVSKKPKGTRLGKGKGRVLFDNWVSRINANKNIFEINTQWNEKAQNLIETAVKILPIPCYIEWKKNIKI